MPPRKVDRHRPLRLTDPPDFGPARKQDLRLIGIRVRAHLHGRGAYGMDAPQCLRNGGGHAACVIDVVLSIVRFMQGRMPRPWWAFSKQRKAALAKDASLTLR